MAHWAVILAGGRGERFWPLSTSKHPKQLLELIGDRSMMGMAIDRLEGVVDPSRILVITNADLVDATCDTAPELPRENVIGEPFGRDTAAAVALAAAIVRKRDASGTFCILTADHVIGGLDLFRATLQEGLDLASREDVLITIGITPTEPATGYGYIHAGDSLETSGEVSFLKAQSFVEKPDLETAKGYLSEGGYYWNAGMFIWSVDSVAKAFRSFVPALADLIDTLEASVDTPQFADALEQAYTPLERISIDYALMERATNIVMAVGAFPWDDVGAWPAVERHFEPDDQGNTGLGDVVTIDATNNIVYSGGRLTALIGVDDLIVVQAEGVTMI